MPLWIDIEELLAFLHALTWCSMILSPIAAILVAFHYIDEWREGRMSPVEKLLRDRHFGGV